MKKIFESYKIGTLEIKNRLVHSAVYEGLADKGHCTDAYVDVYEKLAQGGTGLIITGMVGAMESGKASPGQAGAWLDEFAAEYRKMTDTVHSHGASVVAQLAHCGLKSWPWDGQVPYGPSAVAAMPNSTPRAMTAEDIAETVASFGSAARRIKEAGFDGVQIHAAHGYLLSQFLSPYYNKRDDAYGGPIENRARIVHEAYDSIRRNVGDDFPVLIKINYSDLSEPGMTKEESFKVCAVLAAKGLDAVELSGGIVIDFKTTIPSFFSIKEEGQEAYFALYAKELAETLDIPVIAVGGFRSPAVIEKWLNGSRIAAVSLARPLLAEPDLPLRWERGDLTKAKCISCNRCFVPKKGFGCQTFPQEGMAQQE